MADIKPAPGTEHLDNSLQGTEDNDTIDGFGGDDSLSGQGGQDTLNGGEDNDTLNGGDGSNSLNGDAGDDTLAGQAGDDFLNGGEGDDHLFGNDGADILHGGGGNDFFVPEVGGDDQMLGDGGDDGFYFSATNVAPFAAGNVLNGGAGRDYILVVGPLGIERDFSGFSLTGIENINASGYGVGLTGAQLQGLTLDSPETFDYPNFTSMHAVLKSAGAVNLSGRGSIGVYAFTLNAGGNTLNLTGDRAGSSGFAVYGGAANDVVIGGTLGDSFSGSGGRNSLRGLEGADFLFGEAGADVLEGGTGNDLLDGGADADRMIGGTGNDTFRVDNAADLVTEAAGGGVNVVNTSVSYVLGAGSSVETLQTSLPGAATTINLTGNELVQIVRGNAGANALRGNGGADDLYSGGDSSFRDTFVFAAPGDSGAAAGTFDQVYQFDRSTGAGDTTSDKIDLHYIDADDDLAGNQTFRFGSSFSTPVGTQAEGQVRVAQAGANSVVQIDLNGDNIVDMAIQIVGVTGLTQADFLL